MAAVPETGLVKDWIREAYKPGARGGNPWDDEDVPGADSERYTRIFKFNPEQTLKQRRTVARSWLFLESFERLFGWLDFAGNTAILEEAMAYVESLPEQRQFISPLEYQQKVFKKWEDKMTGKLPEIPKTTPRAKFVWHLRLAMPGWYQWAGGRSDAFTSWVLNGTKFEEDAILNCWEMVFFAAVNAKMLQKEALVPAYEAKKGTAEETLFDTFKNKIIEYKANAEPPKLEAGDIIISNSGARFQHVLAVAGQEKNIKDLKVVHLWGAAGAGTTFYWTMADFFATLDLQSTYYVLRL